MREGRVAEERYAATKFQNWHRLAAEGDQPGDFVSNFELLEAAADKRGGVLAMGPTGAALGKDELTRRRTRRRQIN